MINRLVRNCVKCKMWRQSSYHHVILAFIWGCLTYILFGSFPYISLDKPPLLWHQQWRYIICDVSACDIMQIYYRTRGRGEGANKMTLQNLKTINLCWRKHVRENIKMTQKKQNENSQQQTRGKILRVKIFRGEILEKYFDLENKNLVVLL